LTRQRSIIGLDIGGTKLACVEGSASGLILAREEAPTLASQPFEERFPAVAAMVASRIDLARSAGREVAALSVSVGGLGNAGALAEFHFGVGRVRPGLRHLIFLTFGTGLGAGFIVNGEVLHGASDTAGEVGHWRLSKEGPVGFGKQGSWEAFASGAGLVPRKSSSSAPWPWQWVSASWDRRVRSWRKKRCRRQWRPAKSFRQCWDRR
jgi:glucokinase